MDSECLNGLHSVRYAQSLIQVFAVVLHGINGNAQLAGNGRVGVAGGQQFQHFALAFGQRLQRVAFSRGSAR